jgi:hypothetical protein
MQVRQEASNTRLSQRKLVFIKAVKGFLVGTRAGTTTSRPLSNKSKTEASQTSQRGTPAFEAVPQPSFMSPTNVCEPPAVNLNEGKYQLRPTIPYKHSPQCPSATFPQIERSWYKIATAKPTHSPPPGVNPPAAMHYVGKLRIFQKIK